MSKTIKHLNILSYANMDDAKNSKEFICRGCSMRRREEKWYGYISSISGEMNRSIDNSYLVFEEEPENEYDPNAIMVVVRGEFFGTAGYVGREFTGIIKEILSECKTYRIDVKDENEIGKKDITLVVSWN